MRDGIGPHLGLLLMGLATFTLMGFGQGLIGPSLTEMTRTFGLGEGTAGFLVSAQWVGSAMGVAAMYLWSRRITIRLALTLLALGGAGLALQPAWSLVLVAAVVFGTGYGLSTALFNPRVLRTFGARGPSHLSLLNAAYAAGAIISPLAFVLLGNSSALAFGFAAAAYLVIWLFAAERGDAAQAAQAAVRTGFVIHWPILIYTAIGIGIEACLAGLGPTALMHAGQSEGAAAKLLSAFFVAFLLARLALGVVAHRIGSFTIYVAAMVLAAVASGAAVAGLTAPAFVAMGISAGMFFPGVFVTGSRMMGDDPRVSPMILGAGLAGGIAMPPLLSALSAQLGPLGFFWCLMVITVPTAAAALLSQRSMTR